MKRENKKNAKKQFKPQLSSHFILSRNKFQSPPIQYTDLKSLSQMHSAPAIAYLATANSYARICRATAHISAVNGPF